MNNTAPYTEEMPTSATNPYGQTKFMQEIMLKDIAYANPEMSVALLRYFNPIGAHKSGLIGENPNGVPNNLMPYVTQVAVGKRPELGVFGNDYPTHDGTGVRDYIHVVDLAKGHVAAVDYMESNKGEAVFNLGTGTGYSVLDMVKAFETANGIPVPYVIADRRPGDLATCYADPAKSAQLLHWKATHDQVDMCRDTWNWQSQNPNGFDDAT
jgi:UDP-glucose 4-epimerase